MIQHFFPTTEIVKNPDITILIPALNEAITIGEFVDWCKEGLLNAGVQGQILIIDSSTDETREIALALGAEVLSVPKRGLGQAYIDAIPFVRAPFIIMGDADLTYDMRYLKNFLAEFQNGTEFVMGSRFKGSIEKGAMPLLHQYFGTPLTTWILNRVYKRNFSDIHCGMRGITLDALKRMKLQSQSWQYASEMIIKSVHLNLSCAEVPVIFHKDREGRLSHHKRTGWYAPWLAGWINLKAIFTFGADFFLFKMGLVLTTLGFCGSALLFNGPMNFAGIGFSLHWMLLSLLLFLIGLQFFFMGILAKKIYDLENKNQARWEKFLSLDYATPLASLFFISGFLSILPLLKKYLQSGLHLPAINVTSYHAIGGIGLIFLGVIYFTSALLYNAVVLTFNSTDNR
jgi:glycosyltransferase involved in cell wall biosynthesis